MALTTMYPAKNNSPTTTLTAVLESSGTVMALEDATVLPAAPNLAVIGNSDTAEIVLYTEINGHNVTIVRGQNGTIAGTWTVGSPVARNITALDHEIFRENILDLESRKTDSGHTHDDRYYTESEVDNLLTSKAPLASPQFSGTPSGPTASVSINNTQLATTAYVHDRGLLHLQIQVAGSGTTKSYNCDDITSTMRVINCVFGTPKNVTANSTWTTTTGNITFTGTFAGATTIDVDLMEVDESTATGV